MKQFLPRLLLIDCCRGYNFMAKEYKVHITKYAYEQMTEIKRYIADEIYAPMAAKNLLLAMKSAAISLAAMQATHPLMQEEKWRSQGLRQMVIKNFLMYYWIDEEHSQVNIVAVVYGRREQLAQLEYIDME